MACCSSKFSDPALGWLTYRLFFRVLELSGLTLVSMDGGSRMVLVPHVCEEYLRVRYRPTADDCFQDAARFDFNLFSG